MIGETDLGGPPIRDGDATCGRTLDIMFGDTKTAGGRTELQDLCVVSAVLLLCREDRR